MSVRQHRLDKFPGGSGELLATRGAVLTYFDTTLGWGELLKRTAKETQADDALGLAAQLAYYFFLALFPALLFLVALASVFASSDLIGQLLNALSAAAPPDVVGIIRDQLTKLSQSGHGGIMTFGVAAALWSSSSAIVAVSGSLNRAYDVEESRPWWKQRVTAILLTVGVAAFILVSFVLVVAGPELAQSIAGRFGLGAPFEWTWKILEWPVVFALVAAAIALVYYFAPDVDQDFAFLTPGSLVATFLWLVGSLAFRFYVVSFGSYNATYGAIGGVIVLLLWLYISGLVIIVGAEMNAEIEHASPHGKAAGEKRPGQRKTIGARAAREFRAKQGHVPARDQRPVMAPSSAPVAVMARTGVMLGGLVGALFGRRTKE